MNNMKLLYHSLIHSHLSYGTMLRSSASRCCLRKLEISSNKCIINICNKKYNEHTSPLLKKLNILKLQDISRFELGTFMYNCVHSELPPALMSLFTQNTDIHGHKMPQSHNPHVEHRQNKKIFKTFHQGPKLWNELPCQPNQSTGFTFLRVVWNETSWSTTKLFIIKISIINLLFVYKIYLTKHLYR